MTWTAETSLGNEAGKPVTVYGLSSSQDGVIRYIGQTTQSVAKRLDSHLHPTADGKKRRVWKWLQSVMRNDFLVILTVIEENAVWNESEIRVIAQYRQNGFDLVNLTDGGDGCMGRVWTEEQRIAAGLVHKGKTKSPEHREKIAASLRGKKLSDAHRKKVSESMKGKMPANLELMQSKVRGVPKSAEHRRKLSEAQLNRSPQL